MRLTPAHSGQWSSDRRIAPMLSPPLGGGTVPLAPTPLRRTHGTRAVRHEEPGLGRAAPWPRRCEHGAGDVVREGMLKGVLKIRKAFRLLEEFAGLEMGEAQSQPFLWQLGDLVEDRERNLVANDRGGLEQPLVLGREPIDPC